MKKKSLKTNLEHNDRQTDGETAMDNNPSGFTGRGLEIQFSCHEVIHGEH